MLGAAAACLLALPVLLMPVLLAPITNAEQCVGLVLAGGGARELFLGIDLPLAPVYLGAGFGEDRQRALYLQIEQLID